MRQNNPQAAPLHLCRLVVEQVQKTRSQDHALLGKITLRDVEEAQHRMESRYREWVSLGSANPNNDTITQANDRRRKTWGTWKQERRVSRRLALSYTWAQFLHYLDRYLVQPFHLLTKWNDIGMFTALLIIGTLGASLGLVVAIAFCSNVTSGLAVVASAFVLGGSFSFGASLIVRGSTGDVLRQIETKRNEQGFQKEWARVQYEVALKECIRLENGASSRDRYQEAKQRYEWYRDIHQSKKNQLLVCDWRALRGTPFEHFLKEVFEALGYSVQTTKASGDQGVDLIVTIDGYRIAIQSKGYEGSVGNASVQEVYAGMQFYHCHACGVITNSHFTHAAIDLARSTGCQLIDGSDIPQLIRGELVLVISR